MIRRTGHNLQLFGRVRGRAFGVTIWRRGALSLCAPIGDGVPLQIVIGDWWKAHPELPRKGTWRECEERELAAAKRRIELRTDSALIPFSLPLLEQLKDWSAPVRMRAIQRPDGYDLECRTEYVTRS